MKEIYSGPIALLDQPEVVAAYANDRDFSQELDTVGNLHNEMLSYLESRDIHVLHSDARVKTTERLLEKIQNPLRGQNPVLDLYALQLVVEQVEVFKTIKSIRKRWPMPKEFPWGIRTTRIGGNPLSHPGYRAVHMNFVFNTDKIAEVKLFTPEQLKTEQETRNYYEQKRSLLK